MAVAAAFGSFIVPSIAPTCDPSRNAVNGLNQYTSSGGVALAYDARGNLARSGTDR